MFTINMTHVSLTVQNLHVPLSALDELDLEINLEDCEIEIGELSLAQSIHSTTTESFDSPEPCYHESDTPEEDPRSVAQATADGTGERLIYPH
jgi:hypothetical protein